MHQHACVCVCVCATQLFVMWCSCSGTVGALVMMSGVVVVCSWIDGFTEQVGVQLLWLVRHSHRVRPALLGERCVVWAGELLRLRLLPTCAVCHTACPSPERPGLQYVEESWFYDTKIVNTIDRIEREKLTPAFLSFFQIKRKYPFCKVNTIWVVQVCQSFVKMASSSLLQKKILF